MMLRAAPILATALAATIAAPLAAMPGGRLGTLPIGHYVCALPGDASGDAVVVVEDAWFEIVNASSYIAEGGRGTYLLTGDDVVFTRGPMRGAQFTRQSARTLRKLGPNGELDRMRCTRRGR